MIKREKRVYNSVSRFAQAAETKNRILESAKLLFQSNGFEVVTVENIAKTAKVSAPTIYALFQSKRGILRALMDEAFPSEQFEALIEEGKRKKSVKERLLVTAKLCRQMYDAERAQMDIFRGAAVLAPEFKELEKERELRRYNRQEEFVKTLINESQAREDLSFEKARDIFWAFTGRDLYRMLVIEKGWASEEYQKWLAQLLIKNLLS